LLAEKGGESVQTRNRMANALYYGDTAVGWRGIWVTRAGMANAGYCGDYLDALRTDRAR